MNKFLLNTGKILLGLLLILIISFISMTTFIFLILWFQAYRSNREDKGFNRIYESFKNSAYLIYIGCYWLFAFIYAIFTDRLNN